MMHAINFDGVGKILPLLMEYDGCHQILMEDDEGQQTIMAYIIEGCQQILIEFER